MPKTGSMTLAAMISIKLMTSLLRRDAVVLVAQDQNLIIALEVNLNLVTAIAKAKALPILIRVEATHTTIHQAT